MKARRHVKIQEIIAEETVHTQEELADKLRLAGFEVTQATVSRDIKEMGLIKIPSSDDDYRYAVPNNFQAVNQIERLKRMLRETMISINDAENLIVIRTIPGNAPALAATLDNCSFREVLGSVAGDDTILLVVKPREAVPEVIERLSSLWG